MEMSKTFPGLLTLQQSRGASIGACKRYEGCCRVFQVRLNHSTHLCTHLGMQCCQRSTVCAPAQYVHNINRACLQTSNLDRSHHVLSHNPIVVDDPHRGEFSYACGTVKVQSLISE